MNLQLIESIHLRVCGHPVIHEMDFLQDRGALEPLLKSADDLFHHARFLHAGQLLVEALEWENQLLMVHSEEV